MNRKLMNSWGAGHRLSEVAVIIPALNPDHNLPTTVRALAETGFTRFIVVDDGSSASSGPLFQEVVAHPGVTLLTHAINCGKGRALKTAFNYFLSQCRGYHGVVTVDADGQHAAEDVRKVAEELLRNERSLVLGIRSFAGDVPFRSKLGNRLTRCIFRGMLGTPVSDTQTGLRGIPHALIGQFLRLPGDRYEYETNMLVSACRNGHPIKEVPIQTIYLDGNRASHFDPFRDSLRIYFVLFRFGISSAVTAAIDYTAFLAYFGLSGSISHAMIAGRSCAITVNFLLNRKFVFRSERKLLSSLLAYLALVACMAFVAFMMIQYLHRHFGMTVLAAKLVSEAILFLFSFSIQNNLIFVHPEESSEPEG